MSTTLRSPSKINLGLAIGAVRPDGYHALTTLYQTLALHDLITISARPAPATAIRLSSNDPRVPLDGGNTVWKMLSLALDGLGVTAEVELHLEKRLPIQGGLGAGSANAAVALLALERELAPHGIAPLPGPSRLRLAALVGSDVPLFLIGGAVLGQGRGERVMPLPEIAADPVPCVVAIPSMGVSTPAAFRAWDALAATRPSVALSSESETEAETRADSRGEDASFKRAPLTDARNFDRLEQLSYVYASSFANALGQKLTEPGNAGISAFRSPEKKRGSPAIEDAGSKDLRENPLLSLVRTGMENDFESVVFPQHPPLRDIKRLLVGQDSVGPAIYAALSGSGSALFGLFRSEGDARLAQQRLQDAGCEALLTETLPRSRYWSTMVAKQV